jgi:uncharacterized protein (TIGR03086 family)
MTWRPDETFLHGLDFFSDVVVRVQEPSWEEASPCAGWRVVDVLGHVGSGVGFGTALLRGESPAWNPVEPPGSAVGSDPGGWWSALVEPARQAVRGVDLSRQVDSPMGRRSIGEGLSFPAVDLFVHAWDIGRGAGIDVQIPAEAIEFAHAVLDPIPDEQKRNPQVFAGQTPASSDATATQSFLAWTGRDPGWTPAS